MNNGLNKKLGKRIKEIRESRGLRQVQLAELIDMEPSNLSKLENGNQLPKEENIIKIAKFLNVEIKDLFDFEHKKSKEALKLEVLKIIDEITPNQLEFIYKILINLKFLK